MYNSILWGNSPQEIVDIEGALTLVLYSAVQGGWPGDGSNNINADPMFVDAAGQDLHLSPGSPCIDAADNTAVPPDTPDLDGDGDTAEPIPVDLDGNPRFADDPGVIDCGNGTPPIVDMGAYEFQGATPLFCLADLNRDAVVDAADLALLIGAWGPSNACPPDLNADSAVDAADLALLLGAWGPC